MADYNYDEQGQFFPFFVIALLVLILAPLTYTTLFKHARDTVLRIDCRCTACQQKAALLAEQRKQKLWEPKTIRRYVLLAVGWAIVGYMSYCIATTKIENEIWDPYSILGISPSSSLEKIKSHYKKLSRAMHPDKIKLVGNITKEEVEARFVDVTKAYKALTDEEIRRNYEEYGHPDGKQEFSIGIALPKWIVESSNGYYMLGIYGLSFGVLLPAIVGRWWYGSRRLTREGIETKTAATYFKAVKENTSKDDILNILAESHEYQTYLSGSDQTRHLDSVSLQKILAQAGISLPDYGLSSTTEADNIDLIRNLLHAHLHRIKLPPSFENAKHKTVAEALELQNALIDIALAYNYFSPVRSAMDMFQLLLQAIPIGSSPLLQLPEIDNSIVQRLRVRKGKPVNNIQDLLALEDAERRQALSMLNDEAYSRAVNIAKQIPILIVNNVHFKVTGDKIVTPSAIVQLVFTTRLATEKDHRSSKSDPQPVANDNEDTDDEDLDVLIGRKDLHKDSALVPIPMAHAPYFPQEHKPRWWAFLADPRGNRVIVHPTVISDIGHTARKWRVQFQAPPQIASYLFQLHIKSDSYYGTDIVQEVLLHVQEPDKLQEPVIEDNIPETDHEDIESDEEDDSEEDDDDTETSTDSDSDSDSDSD